MTESAPAPAPAVAAPAPAARENLPRAYLVNTSITPEGRGWEPGGML